MIIIAVAVAVPLIVLAGDDDQSTVTSAVLSTTSTTATETTETSSTSSSLSTTTTTTPPAGPPGDSAGEWVEIDVPEVRGGTYSVSVSDQALVLDTYADDGTVTLYAFMFDSGAVIELPVEGTEAYGADVDGLLTVWYEGTYDENTGAFSEQHIYAYLLPGGPKIEVAGQGREVGYPQVAGEWITWTEGAPWEPNPDEYWKVPIYGVRVDPKGAPLGSPVELAPSAVAFILGDSTWSYSLSGTHLAWEQATTVGAFDPGTYILDLDTMQALIVGSEAWRPSIGGDTVVYWQDGLKVADLAANRERTFDPQGDFPAAGPTFAAYFRPVEGGGGANYEIVARGFTGGYEQVLGEQSYPPWLSPYISAAAEHIAFVADDVTHLFEWRPSASR